MAEETRSAKKTKRALGKGLDALIRDDVSVMHTGATGTRELPVGDIRPNPYQPRHSMDSEALDSLTESVRTHGIMQPVVVRQKDRGYELILGERRWRAATAAGLATVPALVREVNDEEMLCLALVEKPSSWI